MKKIITITVTALFISLFFGSCTTKKQHCDAYGNLSSVSVEENSSEINTKEISENEEVI